MTGRAPPRARTPITTTIAAGRARTSWSPTTPSTSPPRTSARTTAAKGCGFVGLYSEWGSYAPYTGYAIPLALVNSQNVAFTNNTYNGPFRVRLMYQGDTVSWSQWSGGLQRSELQRLHQGPRRGSTFNGSVTAPTTTTTTHPDNDHDDPPTTTTRRTRRRTTTTTHPTPDHHDHRRPDHHDAPDDRRTDDGGSDDDHHDPPDDHDDHHDHGEASSSVVSVRAAGLRAGGTTVTITGTGFSGRRQFTSGRCPPPSVQSPPPL